MMLGTIRNGRHPRIDVELITPKERATINSLLDSGFDGQMALHYKTADRYQLDAIRIVEVSYANGQKSDEIVCRGHINWHGQTREVQIVLSDDEDPAIGTGLLQNTITIMDFVTNQLAIAFPGEIRIST